MQMNCIKKISMLCTLVLACGYAVAAGKLRIVTEEYPPFNMTAPNGSIVGVSTGILTALMERAQLDYSIEVVPWQRAITMARDLPDTCVYSMSRTVEREPAYKWIGPLVENEWTLFARDSDQRRPKTLEEVRGARIGSYSGDAIVRYLQDRKFDVDVATADNNNPRKLQIGRIDYWGTGKLIGLHILRQENISGIVPVLTFNRTKMYLACNRKMDERLADRLNQLLQVLEKDGAIDRIHAAYGYSRN